MSIEGGESQEVQFDVVNDMVIIAAALVSKEDRETLVRSGVTGDHFMSPECGAAWTDVVMPMHKRGLDWDPATAQQLAGDSVDVKFLEDLVDSRGESPPNLKHHIADLFWQRSKKTALEGPINALIEACRDPKSDPERVISLARQVPATFGQGTVRSFLCDSGEVVRQMMRQIRMRRTGEGFHPVGVDALDYFESHAAAVEAGYKVEHIPPDERIRRLLMGAAPGKISVVTAHSGGGKTTFLGNVARFQASKKCGYKKVLVGAWEADAADYLQIITGTKLNYSRTDLMEGRIDDEMEAALEDAATGLSKRITFMRNPFFDGSISEPSNDRNLDIIGQHISDSGCDIFIADLFDRCLEDDRPSSEKRALFRMQAMLDSLRVHGFLAAQQRKDVQLRPDKKPTMEGIQGSGAWTFIADNMFGIHRPAKWKRIEDNSLELFLLKQRHGRDPLGVAIAHDPDTGRISGDGKSIPYDLAGSTSSNGFDETFPQPRIGAGRKKKGK